MTRFPILSVTSASLIALAQAAQAQTTTLDTITLIAQGEENVEATGGAVVTAEDIEALQPENNSELFARESAVTVSGGAGPSKRIHVFGIEQSKLAVSVDGVPQGPTSWHHTGSNVIDPAFLKAVTVEAGAAAADAGFGAAAGAVRYETVGARDMLAQGQNRGGRVALSYGTNGRGLSGSLAGYGVQGGFDYFVMLHGQDGHDYEAGNGHEMPGTDPATRGALVKLGLTGEAGRIELAYEQSRDDADRVIKMNMDLNGDRDTYPLKVTQNTLSLTYTAATTTDMWDPQVRLYTSRNEYARPNYNPGDLDDPSAGSPFPNGDMVLDRDLFGGVVRNTFTIAQGTVTAGIDFAHTDYSVDNYGDHSLAQPRIREFSTMQYGLFAQGRFGFENGIDLSTGLRLDHSSFDDWNGKRFSGTGASANATLSYRINDVVELFAGGSRTWLGYDIGEYGLLHARGPDFATDPDFHPAHATSVKLGMNAGRDGFRGGITVFDTRLRGIGAYDTDAGYLTNDKEGRSKGYTLNASYDYGNGRAGATFTDADVTYDGAFPMPSGGDFMPVGRLATLYVDHRLPQHDLKVGATVEWAGKLSSDAMRAVGFKDHDSYTVVNAYGEWTPPQLRGATLRLGVDNLFDENYYERSSYVERQVGSRDIQPALAPGRSVSLGLAMTF